jgi:hypothetical protein
VEQGVTRHLVFLGCTTVTVGAGDTGGLPGSLGPGAKDSGFCVLRRKKQFAISFPDSLLSPSD